MRYIPAKKDTQPYITLEEGQCHREASVVPLLLALPWLPIHKHTSRSCAIVGMKQVQSKPASYKDCYIMFIKLCVLSTQPTNLGYTVSPIPAWIQKSCWSFDRVAPVFFRVKIVRSGNVSFLCLCHSYNISVYDWWKSSHTVLLRAETSTSDWSCRQRQ